METIITSIIAAASALIGSITGVTVNYFIEKNKTDNNINAEKKKIYMDFIIAIQKFANNRCRDTFITFQEEINKILLYGSAKVAQLVNKYYNAMVEATNAGSSLTHSQHVEFQNRIINEMRREFDKKSEDLTDFYIIPFPANKDEI